MKQVFNITYIRRDGSKIKGRRMNGRQKIELESGAVVSRHWARLNLDYAGRTRSPGEAEKRRAGNEALT